MNNIRASVGRLELFIAEKVNLSMVKGEIKHSPSLNSEEEVIVVKKIKGIYKFIKKVLGFSQSKTYLEISRKYFEREGFDCTNNGEIVQARSDRTEYEVRIKEDEENVYINFNKTR
jgi:hypothetical protein